MMINNSHLTAITRTALPVPVRWLLNAGMIHGHVLDYGCGKCKDLNDKVLAAHSEVKSVTSYDPHYYPQAIDNSLWFSFDVILCTYVLCTLPVKQEPVILKAIQKKLLPNGVAYITVRNDEPKGGYGVSSKGTYQRKVFMPYLFELRRTAQYSIYLLTSDRHLV